MQHMCILRVLFFFDFFVSETSIARKQVNFWNSYNFLGSIQVAKEPLGNIDKENIIEILCKKRSAEISKIMKTCDFPCKYLSCNVPEIVYEI